MRESRWSVSLDAAVVLDKGAEAHVPLLAMDMARCRHDEEGGAGKAVSRMEALDKRRGGPASRVDLARRMLRAARCLAVRLVSPSEFCSGEAVDS